MLPKADKNQNLPQTNDLSPIEIHPFTPLQPTATINQVIEADVNVANNMLEVLHMGFGQAKSIKTICSLINTTVKVLDFRKKTILEQYADKSSIPERNPLFPIP